MDRCPFMWISVSGCLPPVDFIPPLIGVDILRVSTDTAPTRQQNSARASVRVRKSTNKTTCRWLTAASSSFRCAETEQRGRYFPAKQEKWHTPPSTPPITAVDRAHPSSIDCIHYYRNYYHYFYWKEERSPSESKQRAAAATTYYTSNGTYTFPHELAALANRSKPGRRQLPWGRMEKDHIITVHCSFIVHCLCVLLHYYIITGLCCWYYSCTGKFGDVLQGNVVYFYHSIFCVLFWGGSCYYVIIGEFYSVLCPPIDSMTTGNIYDLIWVTTSKLGSDHVLYQINTRINT